MLHVLDYFRRALVAAALLARPTGKTRQRRQVHLGSLGRIKTQELKQRPVNQMITNIIGYTAAVVGTSLMLPQVLKSWTTKKVDDLSFGMLVLYFFNCVLWLIYGLMILAWPVIIGNAIALIVSIIQIILKIKYSRNPVNQHQLKSR